nr:MAG TPA: hypothetical protein [Caudoviricetes sp.]
MISSGQQCNCTFFKELPAGCSLFYKRTNPSSRFLLSLLIYVLFVKDF